MGLAAVTCLILTAILARGVPQTAAQVALIVYALLVALATHGQATAHDAQQPSGPPRQRGDCL